MLILGLIVGGGGGYIFAKSDKALADIASKSKAAATKSSNDEDNPYDGSSLSLIKMYDNLQAASGDEFDRRLMAYLIAMNLNQTGMLRQVNAKSEKAEFKELARIQMQQNDDVAKLLYRWQKEWGYTDH